jgi:hypothetical protein
MLVGRITRNVYSNLANYLALQTSPCLTDSLTKPAPSIREGYKMEGLAKI